MPRSGDQRCRVCGLEQTEPPWGEDGHTPLFTFCACCGVEFGYGDATPIGARRWRARWVQQGHAWFRMAERPEGWSLEEQLTHVPAEFR